MPKKRFSKLKGMIKQAKKFGVDITSDDNITAYLDYRDGTSTAYKTSPQARGASKPITLVPFYVGTYSNDKRHAIYMSGRAATQLTALGLSEANLNIDSGGTSGASQGRRVRRYRAATVTVCQKLAAAVTKKSGITLLDYKKINGESYTFPFGQANLVGKKTYPGMCGFLLKEVAKGTVSVAFKQERPGFS